MTTNDRRHASIVLVLRIGALALAVRGLWPPGPVGDHAGVSLGQAVAMQGAGIVAIEAVAFVLWWLAPRLARGVIKATLPAASASVDVAATAFAMMGFWFAGSALVQLMSLPAHALVLKLIAQSSGQQEGYLLGFVPALVEYGLRIALGVVLMLNARRLSAWLSTRTTPGP